MDWKYGWVASLALLCGWATNVTADDTSPLPFTPQTLDDRVEIGYGLAIGRVDADAWPDIVLADKSAIVWYRNPGERGTAWTRHLMASQLTERDHVCVAARDLDGDGLVEVAVGAQWNPAETIDPAASGAVFFLRRPVDPTQRWTSVPLTPHDPTVHRMHWVRFPDSKFQLVVLPLHGRANRDGEGQPVRITAYQVPLTGQVPATTTVVYEGWHMTHNFQVVKSEPTVGDASGDETLWIASREGLGQWRGGTGQLVIPQPISRGAGEIRQLRWNGATAVAAIEPMHGTDVAVYRRKPDQETWERHLLDASLAQGHALAAADFFNQGSDQVVAGWRNADAAGKVGIRLYQWDAATDRWTSRTLDDNRMACEDLQLADLDQDGRIDVVAAGRATQNVVVYWNDHPLPAAAEGR